MKRDRKSTGRRTKAQVTGSLSVAIFREGRTFVAVAPALDLVAQGRNVPEARRHFQELFEIYLEETLRRGTLEKDLRRCGWEKHSGEFQPPTLTEFPTERMGRDIELRALVIIPLTGRRKTCPA